MAKAPKNHALDKSDDIRLVLKMPGRGSLEHRQVANAFSKIKQALRSSSGGGGGRSGVSSRQRGSAAAGSAAAKAGLGKSKAGEAAKVKPLQRVAVRWTYSTNTNNGQWGAHGKYIERESAQDVELDREHQPLDQDQLKSGPDQQVTSTEKEISDERPSRYDGPGSVFTDGRIRALRKSYLRAIAARPPTQTINDLRSLSSVGMVQRTGQRDSVLQGDAPAVVLKRGSERDSGLRRASDGRAGADRRTAGGLSRKALGFGHEGDAMPISATLTRWQDSGDGRMFKLIISPEFGERMNLKKHVTDLMRQMEKDLGTKLEWVAVEHHNTDHPHAHVAIRGVDDRGQALEVSPEYIAKGSRIRAQELATRELGYRSDHDVNEAMDRQVAQQRFTDIDRTLLQAGNEQGALNIDAGLLRAAQSNPLRQLDFSTPPPADPGKRALRLAQIERLAFLEQHGLANRVGEMKWVVGAELATRKPDAEKILRFDNKPPANERARDARLVQIRRLVQLTEMGLAEKVGNLSWRLNPMMESALRQMQVTQDRLKTKFAHREMISDPSAPLVATELKLLGQRVAGKVVGTGLNEATNRAYILIEGFDGKVHYVNQNASVQKLRGEGALKAGEYVSLEIVERLDAKGALQGTKQKIERFGRTITPELVDQEMLKHGKVIELPAIKTTVAGMFREAAATRLNRLQAVGAVEIVGGAVLPKSAVAHDRVNYQDAGIRTIEFDGKGAILASVVAKGRSSIVVAPTYGRKQILTADQLEAMGLPPKFVAREANVFVGVDAKGKTVAGVIKTDKLPDLVSDRKPNRLDTMLQQLQPIQLPPTHVITDAIRERTAVWTQRGVDPLSKDFLLKANMWRKSVELHEAAQKKGVETVLDGLSKQLGKEVREVPCEPGRQVSGRVLLVNKDVDGQTSVVFDSGRVLTRLKVPTPADPELAAGQRLRATAEQINKDNADRRMVTWRFADLEREQAKSKGKEQGKLF